MSSYQDVKKNSVIEQLNVSEMQVDPDLWGEGAEIVVKEFLLTSYDPKTMPLLAAADVKGREGPWLLGWESEGTDWPPLLVYLFGQEYTDERMAAIKLKKQQPLGGDGRFGFGFHRVRP